MLRLNQVQNIVVAGIVVLALAGESFAQYGSSSSGGSQSGSTGSSSSRTSTGSSSSRSTGSSASQMGSGGASDVQINAGDGSLATQVGTGFIGAGQVGGAPAFVGSAQSTQNQQSRNAGQQFQGMNQNNRRQQQFQTTQRSLPRPQLTIAFDFPAPTPAAMSSGLSTSLAGLRSLPLAAGRFPEVTFNVGDGGMVTLAGSVPDPRSKQLAEMLVKLEPGVRGVTNNLTVAAPSP